MSQTDGASPPKRVEETRATIGQLMMPEHSNNLGTVHGGVIMKLVDEAGAIAATKHAQQFVVTLAIDSMTFHSPVYVGNLLTLQSHLNWVGRTSMEAEVRVLAENPRTGEQTHTNTAYVVYVALDEHKRPVTVPKLILETEVQRKRWQEAEARRQFRLQQGEGS